MTQNPINQFPDFFLLRENGIRSILTIINLIPEPALIFQREKNLIISANNALFLLTQLSERDFIQQGISALLPNIADTDPITGHNQRTLLRHDSQPLIPVNIKIFTLDQAQDILLLLLEPQQKTDLEVSPEKNKTGMLRSLHDLIRIRDAADLESILFKILTESSAFLNTDIFCIYKASGSIPQLVLYLSNDDKLTAELPNRLTSEELALNDQPTLWTPDSPPVTQLQKYAANANYKFMITVPLGKKSAKFGLLVAGDKNHAPNEDMLDLIKIIAAHIASKMEDQISISNLRNLANKIKQVVKIQNEIITNLEEGVIILSPNLTIAEMNPAAEAILGYANIEAVRQHVDSILIGSESLASAYSSAQQGIPTVTSGDLTIHHRNGSSFPAQLMVTPVMMNEQLLSIIVLIRDLSEAEQSQTVRKQLEQRAILGEVTAIFAHEVRNPINAIMLSLQVMEENLEAGDSNLKWVENIREECNKLLYLMESVLSFAKPLEYKMIAVDLREIISRLIERWHIRLMKLNIAPYFECEFDHPIVEGDPRALEQVFTNLISNSVNAMNNTGGSLGIKISEPDSEEDRVFLQITLTDSGHGIPEEIRSHMFKPFVTGSAQGTGLGLAITQRIINAHKGKIEVDSFTGGTIFKIFLLKKKGI